MSAALWPVRQCVKLGLIVAQLFCVVWFCWASYNVRMTPIHDFGYIIHEYDPWFNYRAAEYMVQHGVSKFYKWYDYMSWYPIGRPIGTTTYPGMQMAAYALREAMLSIPPFHYDVPQSAVVGVARSILGVLKSLGLPDLPPLPKSVDYEPLSVNDICCLMGPWFSIPATFFTGMITYEITRSSNACVCGMAVMAYIPAHLMRSGGGKFDNEAVAMAALCATFYFWLRSVRTPSSWPWGVMAGVCYVYMVAAWGGYIFVLNMVGLHALILVGLGRFNSGVHKAYTLFLTIGTYGAIQIPVVGMQPLRSLEQMGPLLVFLGYHVLYFCDVVRWRQQMRVKDFVLFRVRVCAGFLACLVVVAILLYPTGYFGPLSARIRGLFVQHTKTGNPLVDSVAEHQPANSGIYSAYLNLPLDYCFFGGLVLLWKRNNAAYFIALYAFIATHFSHKMNRLILICGPVCAVFCAVWMGFLMDFILEPFLLILGKQGFSSQGAGDTTHAKSNSGKAEVCKNKGKTATDSNSKGKSKKKPQAVVVWEPDEWDEDERPGGAGEFKRMMKAEMMTQVPQDLVDKYYETRTYLDRDPMALLGRAAFSVVFVIYIVFLSGVTTKISTFVMHSHQMSRSLANPKVVSWGQDKIKGRVKIDDYLKGYHWMRDSTAADARIIAWWDYGYQITGIANRTSIADGNTWNHEHIATLGRTLTSPEKKAWNAIRHLADYLMVFAGGRGDDLGKSPHLARIGNSVFPEHCGDDDPRCTKYGFYDQQRSPTPMMAASLLYKAVQHNVVQGVRLNSNLFKEVHTTKNGLMRIYEVVNVSQESKEWLADPANRVCDAPGSWYCVGQYPPALAPLIARRRNFAQVEDFNKGGEKSAYTKLIEQERSGKKEL